MDGPQTLEILRQIETHFGKPIQKLDAEDVDEIEKIQKNWRKRIICLYYYRKYLPSVKKINKKNSYVLKLIVFR